MENRARRGSSAAILNGNGCGDERVQIAISSYFDGEADATERAMAEWHLAECRACNELLGVWGRDSGRVKQVAHDLEVDRIARAITDQTRASLLTELAATAVRPLQPRRPSARPTNSWRLAFGTLAAALMLFSSVLTLSLGSFGVGSTPLTPTTAATTNLTMTLAVASPATVSRAQPLASAPNFPLLTTDNGTPQAEPSRLRATSGVGHSSRPLFYATPGIAPTKAAPLTRD